jgi:uncharacterized protein
MSSAYSRSGAPATAADPSAPYREALEKGELLLARCVECEHARLAPRTACPSCGSRRPPRWERASGRGRIWSHVTFHKRYLPDGPEVPYTVVLVELEEGPKVISALTGLEGRELRVGLPVRARLVPGSHMPLRFEPTDTEETP